MNAALAWLTSHWGWMAGAGAALAFAVAVFLNPLLAAQVARRMGAALLKLFRAVADWLGEPGNWAKAMALGLALFSGYSLLALRDARSQITVITQARAADSALCDAEKALLGQRIKGYEAQEAATARAIRAETEQLDAAQQQSAEAIEQIQARQDAAEKSNQAWWRVYEGRPDVCKAAQEALDVACKEVGRL